MIDQVLAVVAPLVVFVLFCLVCSAFTKALFSQFYTSDGDRLANRLMGRGPQDEILSPSWRDQLRAWRARRRLERERPDGSAGSVEGGDRPDH